MILLVTSTYIVLVLHGFTGTDALKRDTPCSWNFCDVNAICTDLPGNRFNCTCKAGYKGDGRFCKWQSKLPDPCASNPCDPNTVCRNIGSSYFCSTCNQGYVINGRTCTEYVEPIQDVKKGARIVQSSRCSRWILQDNQAFALGNCLLHRNVGNWCCVTCRRNYKFVGTSQKVFEIQCMSYGWHQERRTMWSPPSIPRCQALLPCKSNPCDPNASCREEPFLPDGYACTCNRFYTGDGRTCIKVPCVSNPCDPNASCREVSRVPEGYTCTCNRGYTGDGRTCIKMPCVSNPCDPNASCREVSWVPEGYTCTCNRGYTGDGMICLRFRKGCDFDLSYCDWRQSSNDDADWTRLRGKTPSLNTGPSSDHAIGNGWYVYFEASSPRKHGDTADLLGPEIENVIPVCLCFYYHMQGSSMGSLKVFTFKNRLGDVGYRQIWMKEGQQSQNDMDWKFAEITIIESEPYQLIIRATGGTSYRSDIALDDIAILSNACGWLEWEKWGGCNKACGDGVQTRVRVCPTSNVCSGSPKETRPCNLRSCTTESQYSPCSRTCGDGVQQKLQGTEYVTKHCKLKDCAAACCGSSNLEVRFKNDFSCCMKTSTCNRPFVDDEKRVIGGTNSKRGQWPWMAYISHSGGLCGGSVIASKYILTAAHCLQTDTGWRIAVNTMTVNIGYVDLRNTNMATYALINSFIYPDYVHDFPDHDIGILELKDPIKFNDYIQPLCLPHCEEVPDDTICIAMGWGVSFIGSSSRNDILQHVDVKVLNPNVCIHAYSQNPDLVEYVPFLKGRRGYICAGDLVKQKDSCSGDSGSPLACQRCDNCGWYVAGVVSFGPKPCADKKAPGIYTKVTDYEQWIYHVTGIPKESLSCSTG